MRRVECGTCGRLCMCLSLRVCMHASVRVCVCACVHACVRVRVPMCMHVSVCLYVRVRECYPCQVSKAQQNARRVPLITSHHLHSQALVRVSFPLHCALSCVRSGRLSRRVGCLDLRCHVVGKGNGFISFVTTDISIPEGCFVGRDWCDLPKIHKKGVFLPTLSPKHYPNAHNLRVPLDCTLLLKLNCFQALNALGFHFR